MTITRSFSDPIAAVMFALSLGVPVQSVTMCSLFFSDKRLSMKMKIYQLLFHVLGNLLLAALLVDCYMPNPPPIANWLINWGSYTWVPADTLIRMEMFKSFVPLADNEYVTVKRVTQIQIGMIVLYFAGVIGHFVALGYIILYSEQPNGLDTYIKASIYMIVGPIYGTYNAMQIIYIVRILFVAIEKVERFKARQVRVRQGFLSSMWATHRTATDSTQIKKSTASAPSSPTPLRPFKFTWETSRNSTKIMIDAESVVRANRLMRTIIAQIGTIMLGLGCCMYGGLTDTLIGSYVFHLGITFG
jgi:hypothetical protein